MPDGWDGKKNGANPATVENVAPIGHDVTIFADQVANVFTTGRNAGQVDAGNVIANRACDIPSPSANSNLRRIDEFDAPARGRRIFHVAVSTPVTTFMNAATASLSFS